ncbi:poly alpha-glucosyltransferase [Acinetobacter wanghuae]|uniref:Poly alpha-glucosyltransferase n=1 Tax=Acinetobacter wanghuae TaxID=2662362 RepID=A0A5Q0P7T7_9GAMM|nr:poly alpha-glucosyltransferase [Acinetobacter wanghuae]MQW91367.1 poly alpha-glucosyltransferase [Acinetobacter wanghuae]QGA11728.1 poly alpha-glucosyltransferase [Acinetobacter wanghuae]
MKITTQSQYLSFKEKLKDWLNQELITIAQAPYVVFISYGEPTTRCKVWSTNAPDAKTALNRTLNFLDKMYDKKRGLPEYLKFDIAVNIKQKSWQDVKQTLNTQMHNNHFRKGVSFDSKFEICFLEQELYGKALIRGIVYNQPTFWDQDNVNRALHSKYPTITKNLELDQLKHVWLFDTVSAFYEDEKMLNLQSTGPVNGVRELDSDLKTHIRSLVLENATFLHNELQEDGRFIYGYFPAYDRELKSYNTVRHCTAVYALLETLEVDDKEEYLTKIRLAIEYAIQVFYKEEKSCGFMIDGEDEAEIKLGSNAAAIFMFAKYQEITQDAQYQSVAEKLAEGILYMVDDQGKTTHVLDYPSLETKEQFRIVYYDGEAALGLLRLYQINQDATLLQTVKLMFEHFIEKKYDKYHDHWLSYCTNELTKICPEEKYFEFGLNNYLKHMKFIAERKTAYATFLEMMMSAYKMVIRMREQGFDELYEKSKFEELKKLIEQRVEFQRSAGYFYPEVAMYMAKPEKILNAFYVRHDRFRTRIDDQEHNLSGYIAYLNYFE